MPSEKEALAALADAGMEVETAPTPDDDEKTDAEPQAKKARTMG